MNIIIILSLISMLFADENYKEVEYLLLSKEDNIEIREYGTNIIAKITTATNDGESENDMFRVLFKYIFGDNNKNEKIPMTTPVTTYQSDDIKTMIFYMLDSDTLNSLPLPNNNNISLEKFSLGKCAVIKFSWYTPNFKIKRYQNKLNEYLINNDIEKI